MSTLSVHVQQLNQTVYVDSAWAGSTQGQSVTDSFGTYTFGINAFATIQNGVTFVASGGTVNVHSGTYAENVTINQPLTLDGPFASTAGFGVGRGTGEAVVEPASGSSYLTSNVITVEASNVTIARFHDRRIQRITRQYGHTTPRWHLVTSRVTASPTRSAWTITPRCPPRLTLFPTLPYNNDVVENTAQGGIYGNNSNLGPTTGNVITGNLVQNVSANDANSFGYGIYVLNNFYAAITSNHVIGAQNAIQVENFYQADPNASPTQDLVDSNVVDYYHRGFYLNLQYGSASPYTISNNQITADAAALANNKKVFRSSPSRLQRLKQSATTPFPALLRL